MYSNTSPHPASHRRCCCRPHVLPLSGTTLPSEIPSPPNRPSGPDLTTMAPINSQNPWTHPAVRNKKQNIHPVPCQLDFPYPSFTVPPLPPVHRVLPQLPLFTVPQHHDRQTHQQHSRTATMPPPVAAPLALPSSRVTPPFFPPHSTPSPDIAPDEKAACWISHCGSKLKHPSPPCPRGIPYATTHHTHTIPQCSLSPSEATILQWPWPSFVCAS